MRVNIYAEEMTERVEIISKEIDGQKFTGLRLYLELPATFVERSGERRTVAGPFIHRPGDDDSSAVTFWGKRDLRVVLRKMLEKLDAHYFDALPEHKWDALRVAARVRCMNEACDGQLRFRTDDAIGCDAIGGFISIGANCPRCGTRHRLRFSPTVEVAKAPTK